MAFSLSPNKTNEFGALCVAMVDSGQSRLAARVTDGPLHAAEVTDDDKGCLLRSAPEALFEETKGKVVAIDDYRG